MERKKFAALVFAFGFIFLMAGLNNAIAAGKKTHRVAKSEKTAAAKDLQVSGEVTAVNHDAMTVTLKDKAGKEFTLQVAGETLIKEGKENKTLKDISPGEKLTATYHEVEGKRQAKSIVLE